MLEGLAEGFIESPWAKLFSFVISSKSLSISSFCSGLDWELLGGLREGFIEFPWAILFLFIISSKAFSISSLCSGLVWEMLGRLTEWLSFIIILPECS